MKDLLKNSSLKVRKKLSFLLDYLKLIYLFYRHPSQAFEKVYSGKKVHGAFFCIIYLFIINLIIYLGYSCLSGILMNNFPPIGISSVDNILLCTIVATFSNSIVFFVSALIIFVILWIMRLNPPFISTLSVIFYSLAIVYPFCLIMALYLTGIDIGVLGIIFSLFYIVLRIYVEYLGLFNLLRKSKELIIIAIIVSVFIDLYVLIGYEYLVIGGFLQWVFGYNG